MTAPDGPHRYQARPVRVEAWQITDENLVAVANWCGGIIMHDLTVALPSGHRAAFGDYVVKRADGDPVASEPDIFMHTYTPMLEHPTPARIGIGVITRNRRDCVVEVVDAIRELTTMPFDLVVGVDHTEDDTVEALTARDVPMVFPSEQGIPANRNAVLSALRHHDVIVLFEDDHKPIAAGWDLPYVEVLTTTPVKVLIALAAVHGPMLDAFVSPGGHVAGWRPNMGCVMVAMHKSVLDVVGGWDPAFGDRYGLDDGHWAHRCRRAGLTGHSAGFPCLYEAGSLTGHIPNPPSSDGKTTEQREADIRANWSHYLQGFTGGIHVPLDGGSQVEAA